MASTSPSTEQKDFAAKLEKLRVTIAGDKTEQQRTPERRTAPALFREPAAEHDSKMQTALQVENTKIYHVLADPSTNSEAKVDAITDMLVFQFEDPHNEAQRAALEEVRAILQALIEDFTTQSSESIRMTKDNPLSALTEHIRAVFENYHALVEGRKSLKDKLEIIQGFIDKHEGDDQALIKALAEAQDKKGQKEQLERAKKGDEEALREAAARLEHLNTEDRQLERRLQDNAGIPLLKRACSPSLWGKKAELQQQKEALAERKAEEEDRVQAATQKYEASKKALEDFLGNSNYAVYEEILKILDIGNVDFKNELKRIAEQTLQYIADTRESLTGVREQLANILEDVKKSLDVSVNTSEKIAVLQQALTNAQDRNAQGYKDFTAKVAHPPVAGLEGLGEFEQRRTEQNATEFTAAMSRCITSTTEIAGNIELHRTTLGQLRSDLENGVVNAEGQLLKAVSTSAATGQTMLQRTERMAAMAQKVVADSMYGADLAESFRSVAADFTAQLQAQVQRNSDLSGFSELVGQLTQALEARNDTAIEIAAQQTELVSRLADNIKKLEEANKNASEIDTVIAASTLEQRAAAQAVPKRADGS